MTEVRGEIHGMKLVMFGGERESYSQYYTRPVASIEKNEMG